MGPLSSRPAPVLTRPQACREGGHTQALIGRATLAEPVTAELHLKPQFKLWLELRGRSVLGAGRVELLREVEREGSLAQAARKVGISYGHAYKLISELNVRCGRRVTETLAGGPKGGHTRLTEFGRWLVEEYERTELRIRESLETLPHGPLPPP